MSTEVAVRNRKYSSNTAICDERAFFFRAGQTDDFRTHHLADFQRRQSNAARCAIDEQGFTRFQPCPSFKGDVRCAVSHCKGRRINEFNTVGQGDERICGCQCDLSKAAHRRQGHDPLSQSDALDAFAQCNHLAGHL